MQKSQADWLPLEPFDDSEYDCRTPIEWMSLGWLLDDDAFDPISGRGLWFDEEGGGHWRRVLIYSYNLEEQAYEGVWDGTTDKSLLTRINLLFDVRLCSN
jgi:hypothetical protein